MINAALTQPNSKKNRSAMRAKAKKKELQSNIKEKLGAKKEKRKKVQFSMPKVSNEDDTQVNKAKERLYNLCHQQISANQDNIFSDTKYSDDRALMIARVMQQIKEKIELDGVSFIQQYYITKGLKLFKEEGEEAAIKEMEMMLQRNCFSPIHVEDLSESERRKAADAMLLLEKRTMKLTKVDVCSKEVKPETGSPGKKHPVPQLHMKHCVPHA